MCCVQDSPHIEQPQSIANNRTHACSVGQSASRRKEGKSPAQGAQTNQLNPLSVGPHLPHQGLICAYLLAHAAGAKGSSTGVLRTTSDGTELLSLCTRMYRSCCHHAPCLWASAHTAWHNTHKHHNTSHITHHSTAQHSTTQHNPVSLTRHITTHTHTTPSASWPPSSAAIQHSAAQLPDMSAATLRGPGRGIRCRQPPADSHDDNSCSGPDSFRPNPSGPSMGI